MPSHLMPERYNSYSRYLKAFFGERVHKIPLTLGLPCPNKDGTISHDGCIFCDEFGSGPLHPGQRSIPEQLRLGMDRIGKKRQATKFIAYFQANTSTAAPVERLHRHGEEVLAFPEVVGISLGTRPDFLPPEHLDLLVTWHQRTFLQVELGLQSIQAASLDWLRRHHTLAQFEQAFAALKERGIRICVHMILGIPGEGEAEAAAAARYLSIIGADGVKIHPLHVLKRTQLEVLYNAGEFIPPTLDTYIRLVATFLEHLDNRIVIQRLTGEREQEIFVAPPWARDKAGVLGRIRAELEKRDSFQGKAHATTPE